MSIHGRVIRLIKEILFLSLIKLIENKLIDNWFPNCKTYRIKTLNQ